MTAMELWFFTSISLILLSSFLVPLFGEFIESVDHPKEVAEAIFFTATVLMFVPVPAALFLEGSVKNMFLLCIGTALGHIAMRYRMGLSAVPPSPSYIWNAEKTLFRSIMRKDHP
jgi:hypothetical protein